MTVKMERRGRRGCMILPGDLVSTGTGVMCIALTCALESDDSVDLIVSDGPNGLALTWLYADQLVVRSDVMACDDD